MWKIRPEVLASRSRCLLEEWNASPMSLKKMIDGRSNVRFVECHDDVIFVQLYGLVNNLRERSVRLSDIFPDLRFSLSL